MDEDLELQKLIKNCINNPETINELSENDAKKALRNMSMYGNIKYEPKNKYTCISISNLYENYIKRIEMLSLVGYLYRALEEYNGTSDKKEIYNYLNSIFEFNPDYHVKRAAKTKDGECPDIKNEYKNVPADTFFRVDNYRTVNYEAIRGMTEKLFHEKSELDFAINIYDNFETLEDANAFVVEHQDEFIHDVHTIQNNNWVLLSPFKKNRAVVNIYNKNTEKLESILKQIESDSKLGKDLMKKRVTNEKRQNIRQHGTHSEDVGSAMGNTETIADAKDANNLELDDSPFLRVNVFENDGIDIKKSHFYTEPIAPKPPI